MTYDITIMNKNGGISYINEIATWNGVKEILQHGLDQYAQKVHIYKYSSDNRLLGYKCVTMGNLWEVANALRDNKVLI